MKQWTTTKKRGVLLSLFILITISSLFGGVKFSATEWDFGVLYSQEVVQQMDLLVTNTGNEEIKVFIIPTCNCLTVTPSEEISIPAQGTQYFKLFYDPFEDSGPVERQYQIRTSVKGLEVALFKVSGFVDAGELPAEETEITAANEDPTGSYDVAALYYYMSTCPKCRKFINEKVPALEKELGIKIGLFLRRIDDAKNLEECLARLEKMNVKQEAFPTLVIGKKVLQGEGEINDKIKEELLFAIKNNIVTDTKAVNTEGVDILKRNLTIFPVLGAGLIDGINPCAFATIIMLLTSMALAGKRRKEILIIGIFFTISVFVTYYLVGVGFFIGIQAASSYPIVASVIKWALFAVLIVFAALSVYDYTKIRAGKSNEMVLQLHDLFKKKIKDSIQTHVRSAALVFSSLLLGFLVSVFELGCTGQVYLPTIVAMVRVGDSLWGFIFLFIYCIGFIAPLVAVFIVTYRGLSTKKLIDVFRTHMGKVKLSLAGLFLVLAVITIIL